MSMTNEYLNCWIEEEQKMYDDIVVRLNQYEMLTAQSLAVIVSAMCNMRVSDMLAESRSHKIFARWLLYYAYQYMTNAPIDKIAEEFAYDGTKPIYSSVRHGILSIQEMIANDKIWRDRWEILKKVIKNKKATSERSKEESFELTLGVPKELKNKVTLNIKEL